MNEASHETGVNQRRARPTGPPRLPFALTVGVTGHRLDALPVEAQARLCERVAAALRLLETEAIGLFGREADLFAPDPPLFTLVSPLADGADQIAAEAALDQGWRLQAVLPFDRTEYLRDFTDPEDRTRFEDLLARSDCVLELPGDPSDSLDA